MKLSKQETIIVSYVFDGVTEYVATRNATRKYTLYKQSNNDYTKIKTSDNPLKFDDIIENNRGR